MRQSCTALYRDLWVRVLGALDPGTDLHAAVLAIAPPSWDADLTDDTGGEQTLRRIAADFPGWHLSRPPSPDGTHPWWGARDGHTVIITSTPGELRAALAHQREGTSPGTAQVFPLDQAMRAAPAPGEVNGHTTPRPAAVKDLTGHFPGRHIAGAGHLWSAARDWKSGVLDGARGHPRAVAGEPAGTARPDRPGPVIEGVCPPANTATAHARPQTPGRVTAGPGTPDAMRPHPGTCGVCQEGFWPSPSGPPPDPGVPP